MKPSQSTSSSYLEIPLTNSCKVHIAIEQNISGFYTIQKLSDYKILYEIIGDLIAKNSKYFESPDIMNNSPVPHNVNDDLFEIRAQISKSPCNIDQVIGDDSEQTPKFQNTLNHSSENDQYKSKLDQVLEKSNSPSKNTPLANTIPSLIPKPQIPTENTLPTLCSDPNLQSKKLIRPKPREQLKLIIDEVKEPESEKSIDVDKHSPVSGSFFRAYDDECKLFRNFNYRKSQELEDIHENIDFTYFKGIILEDADGEISPGKKKY